MTSNVSIKTGFSSVSRMSLMERMEKPKTVRVGTDVPKLEIHHVDVNVPLVSLADVEAVQDFVIGYTCPDSKQWRCEELRDLG
jgi:hypothetical protein